MTSHQFGGNTEPGRYEIRLHGQLDQRWSEWFGGFTITDQSDGTTTLTGPVVDQAALHGLLRRVGDLGVTLISLNTTHEPKDCAEHRALDGSPRPVDQPAVTPPAGLGAMTVTAARITPKRSRAPWLAPTGLILLALIPILAGGMRLTELTGNPVATPANARFLDSPIPVVTHIVTVTIFSILGAFQFVPALRRRRGRWHRMAGSILIPSGILAALSGMWMAAFYPHPAGDGPACCSCGSSSARR